ncbi:MAG: DUF429 domain-containing protein [Actinomycetes bacterium]
MTSVLGVDGCPGGWVGALVGPQAVRWLLLPDARAVLAVDAEAVAVDIPMGLPDQGPRDCDQSARRLLREQGAAASSVFPAPVRAVLGCTTYDQACAVSRDADGRALSQQTWALVPRIRDVDGLITPEAQARVVESHPEVSYRLRDGTTGRAVHDPKRTPRGAGQRVAALSGWLDAAAAVATLPAGPRLDDALDALVLAWTASRWQDGTARTLPADGTPRDARGLAMRIVA